MSLWAESLAESTSGLQDSSEKAKIIFAHLATHVPRSWWERCLQKGKLRKSHVLVLWDLSGALKKCPGLQGRINYSLLVAMAFLDDKTQPSFGNLLSTNQHTIEEYIAGAEKLLAERPDVRRLGKRVTKMAIQIETEMEGKYCPKCNKRMREALIVTEIRAKWWLGEGYYIQDESKNDDMKTYEKCLVCETVLIEKPVKSTKKAKKEQRDFKHRISDEYWEHVHNLDYLVANAKVDPEDTERHINFRVSDATMMPRDEVERQHNAWHKRQTEARIKIPEKLPYMSGKKTPFGYIESIKMIDKTHPRWEETLKMYLKINNSKILNEGKKNEISNNTKIKKGCRQTLPEEK